MGEAFGNLRGAVRNRHMAAEPIDPGIDYPCYKSLDDYIDVERLRALDADISNRVGRFADRAIRFNTGAYKRSLLSRRYPGSRIIRLTVPRSDDYRHIAAPYYWEPAPYAGEFAPLMEFIASLPFAATGRAIIMCDARGRRVPAHRDHTRTDWCQEFIWFRPNLDKRLFLTGAGGRRRCYVESHSAWFDTVNQFHGSDPSGGPVVSLRVDGVFSDAPRAEIPEPGRNVASTAALWACSSR